MTHTITHTSFEGVFHIESDIFSDNRWDFRELYHEKAFRAMGIEVKFVQDNISVSKKWALRGLHFQKNHPQSKLIYPLRWKIFDVIVDIRRSSLTYGKVEGFILEVGKWLFLPKGFAHGFLSLEDDTIVVYKCDDFYHSEDEWGIFLDDETLGIDWKKICEIYSINVPIVSEKDKDLPHFSELNFSFYV